MTGRRLARVPWWVWALAGAGWAAAAVAAAPIVGRVLRHGGRPTYTPQTDAPLWRGTDLDHTATDRHGIGMPEWAAQHVDRILAADDGLPDWSLSPLNVGSRLALDLSADDRGSLLGATQMLANATDETAARFWLAVCARRGATWEQQRDLWAEWQRLHDSSVHYLDTRRPEDPRP